MAASGLHLAARCSLVLPPPLSARALVEAFPLHVLEQPGFGDLAAELLQDVLNRSLSPSVTSIPPHLRSREPPRNTTRTGAAAQVLGTVSGSYRSKQSSPDGPLLSTR